MLIFRSGNLKGEHAPLKCQGKTMMKAKDIAQCKSKEGGRFVAYEQKMTPACEAGIGRLARIKLNHYDNLNDPYYPKNLV